MTHLCNLGPSLAIFSILHPITHSTSTPWPLCITDARGQWVGAKQNLEKLIAESAAREIAGGCAGAKPVGLTRLIRLARERALRKQRWIWDAETRKGPAVGGGREEDSGWRASWSPSPCSSNVSQTGEELRAGPWAWRRLGFVFRPEKDHRY